jgi:DNA repair exonuclease SbcCD ATPase subunit
MSGIQDNPTEATTNDTPEASQPDSEQGQQNAATQEATFTQADIDRIIADRLKRDRDARQSKLLEELGVSDVDTLKQTLEAERKRKEAEMSEVEKAQAEIEKANKKAQEAEHRLQEMQQQILQRDRKSAFLKAIQANGGKNEDDLFILVTAKFAEAYENVFDGATPKDSALSKFVKDVQTAFPAYFGSSGAGSPSNAQGVAPTSVDKVDEAMDMWRRHLRN